ncbi:MAG: hypothetical protein J1F64_04280 [Oscillospiraceae bacterium]|nr:hypothetical protein [Oscillospiraceae bacterium]
MKRKMLSLFTALVMLVSAVGFTAFADNDDNAPTVVVDGHEVVFADQKPVILEAEGRTLVPARGVFECMGARVDWDGEKRLVTINSENNITRILITIDDPTMVVYTFTSLLSADKNEIALDAAPRIMNDRTMIPLRAISEALKAQVDWDESTRTITIMTKDYAEENNAADKPEASPSASGTPKPSSDPSSSPSSSGTPKPSSSADPDDNSNGSASSASSTFNPKNVTVSLSTDKTTAKTGDIIEVTVSVSGIQGKFKSDEGILGVTTTINYDKNVLEYVENSAEYNTAANVTSVANPEFMGADKLKAIGIFVDAAQAMRNDGEVARFKFKVLSETPTTLNLANGYVSGYGYETSFSVMLNGDTVTVGKDLKVDTSKIDINR